MRDVIAILIMSSALLLALASLLIGRPIPTAATIVLTGWIAAQLIKEL